MSETLDKLKQLSEQTREYISVTELPPELEANLIGDLIFKTDKRENECCFITLKTPEGKYITQKYTPTQYTHLHDQIIKCGGITNLQNTAHIWKKQRIGRAINERLFPQPKPKKK